MSYYYNIDTKNPDIGMSSKPGMPMSGINFSIASYVFLI